MKPLANIADILIVAALGIITWLSANTSHGGETGRSLPDRVVVTTHKSLTPDEISTALRRDSDELSELDYYIRMHKVDDEGFNIIANYNSTIVNHRKLLLAMQRTHQAISTPLTSYLSPRTTRDTIAAKDRQRIAVKTTGGFWLSGHFFSGMKLHGPAIAIDHSRRIIRGTWQSDTIVTATRTDSRGTYHGQMDTLLQASGQGTYDLAEGGHYEGFWLHDKRHGFGFESSPHHQLRAGEWRNGKFLGERLTYTAQRIYGIDISRYQHEKGRQRFPINWRGMRITSLGQKNSQHANGAIDYPVSFVYIKATESTVVKNQYFAQDYRQARRNGIHVGAYHFFSLRKPAQQQATFFLKNAVVGKDDFPPVLDVEPTNSQIESIGGDAELMRRIRIWMNIVEKQTGKRPILYVSQNFVTQHMRQADDIKKQYNVWIARYSDYKPDVKLVYWQLTPNGRVSGIHLPVDINVFNGYSAQFEEFIRTGFHK